MSKLRIPAPALCLLGLVILMSGCASAPQRSWPAAAGQTQGLYAEAQSAYESRNYFKAADDLIALSQQGDPRARYALGYMYYYGQGVLADRSRAMLLFRQAAAQGNAKAQEALAMLTGKGATSSGGQASESGSTDSGSTAVTGAAPVPPVASSALVPPTPVPGNGPPASKSPAVKAPAPAPSVASGGFVPSTPPPGKSPPAPKSPAVRAPAPTPSMSQKAPAVIDIRPEATSKAAPASVPQAPAQPAAPASSPTELKAPTRAGTSANQPFTLAWLRSQDPEHLTIQLIAASRRDKLVDFIKRHHLTNKAAILPATRTGHAWYVVIYGVYSSRFAARESMRALPPALQRNGPWIRQLGEVVSRATQG